MSLKLEHKCQKKIRPNGLFDIMDNAYRFYRVYKNEPRICAPATREQSFVFEKHTAVKNHLILDVSIANCANGEGSFFVIGCSFLCTMQMSMRKFQMF